jgi:hypothetical protein
MDQNNKDGEINLGDLGRAISLAFQKLGLAFIRLAAFILRNIVVLALLIIVGVGIGYFVNQQKTETYQTSFTVANFFASTDFLNKEVEEIDFALKSQDSSLMGEVGINEGTGQFSLVISPIFTEKNLDNGEREYYELLSENDFIEGEAKEKMFKNSFNYQRVTLTYPAEVDGPKILMSILDKIRQNDFYKSLIEKRSQDIKDQIESNEFLIKQIDRLVKNYASNLGASGMAMPKNNQENVLDMGRVIGQRTQIQIRNEKLIEQNLAGSEFLKVLDKGRGAPMENGLSANKVIIYPVLLIIGFLFVLLLVKIFKLSRDYNQKNHA